MAAKQQYSGMTHRLQSPFFERQFKRGLDYRCIVRGGSRATSPFATPHRALKNGFHFRDTLPGKVVRFMFQDDDLVPLSALQHVVYCQRRAALVYLEAAWGESSSTVEGAIFHERVHLSGTESRGDIRLATGVRLRSLNLGLTGQADVVEFHRVREPKVVVGGTEVGATAIALEGVCGLWKPYPVEYKIGKLRSERSYEVQLCGQAICLEEMLQVKISTGAIYFGKTARRLEVVFDQRLRAETETAAKLLHEVLASRVTPKAKYGKKCPQCSLLDLCMPKVTEGAGRVKSYLKRCITIPIGDEA